MKKHLLTASILLETASETSEGLSRLINDDKATCLQKLEAASDSEVWDVFLTGQTDLFFDLESTWLAKNTWWKESKNILDIGSGNGDYLYRLSSTFHKKRFCGIELVPQSVEKATNLYAHDRLTFQQGDAEVFNERLKESADVVMFHATLMHLQNERTALENAAKYLKPNGYVLIMDGFDPAYKSFPPVTAIDNAMQLAAEVKRGQNKKNRQVSFELLQALSSDAFALNDVFEVVFSSIDTFGNEICNPVCIKGALKRKQFSNHALLLLSLFQRTYNIPVDLDKAFDELCVFVNEKNGWMRSGMHFLVLRKK